MYIIWKRTFYTAHNWSFVNRKTYIGQSPKPQVDSNWLKRHPPLFCLLVRYLAHIVSCDVTLPNHISCIIEHLIWDLAESPPPFQAAKQGKILRLDLSISCNFQQLWFSWQKSQPPSFSAFLWETKLMSHMWNTHGPHTTNPHSDSSYLNIFFRLPTLSTFQNTHI